MACVHAHSLAGPTVCVWEGEGVGTPWLLYMNTALRGGDSGEGTQGRGEARVTAYRPPHPGRLLQGCDDAAQPGELEVLAIDRPAAALELGLHARHLMAERG